MRACGASSDMDINRLQPFMGAENMSPEFDQCSCCSVDFQIVGSPYKKDLNKVPPIIVKCGAELQAVAPISRHWPAWEVKNNFTRETGGAARSQGADMSHV